MRRETKLNLAFLIGFLLLSLPGVVILFVKKLDPNERPMSAPPYVRTTAAYNNPVETRSDTVRVVPPQTRAWVDEVARRHAGSAPVRVEAAGGRSEPIISDGRCWELLAIRPDAAAGTAAGTAAVEVVLLAWSDEFGREQVRRVAASLTTAGGAAPVVRTEVEPVSVPPAVVAELKDEGYVLPPTRAAVVRLVFAAPPADIAGPARLEIAWETATDRRSDVLQLARPLPAGAGAGKPDPASRPTKN